jgi:hypothetical protein
MSGSSVVTVTALGPALIVDPAIGLVATSVLAYAAGILKKSVARAIPAIVLATLFT